MPEFSHFLRNDQGLPPGTPGLSHLAEDRSCEGVGPSCAFAVSGDGEVWSGLLQQVEGEFPWNCQGFRAVILAVPGAVLVEGHIRHPVGRIPDGPMGADGGGEACWREAGRGQVEPCGGCPCFAGLAGTLDAGDAGQARKARPPMERQSGNSQSTS